MVAFGTITLTNIMFRDKMKENIKKNLKNEENKILRFGE